MNEPMHASVPAHLRPLLDLHPADRAREVRLRDLVYACHLYFGVALALAFLLNLLPADTWVYRGLSRVFGSAVLVGFLPAGLGALCLGVRLRRDPPVLALALAVGGIPLVLWAASRSPLLGDPAGAAYFGLFTAMALGLALRWFLVLRRRLRVR